MNKQIMEKILSSYPDSVLCNPRSMEGETWEGVLQGRKVADSLECMMKKKDNKYGSTSGRTGKHNNSGTAICQSYLNTEWLKSLESEQWKQFTWEVLVVWTEWMVILMSVLYKVWHV